MLANHPHIEQLSAFAQGKLESADVDAVESHLASCETCCDAIKQIKEDTFVGLVRQAKAAPTDDAGLPRSAPLAGEATIATGGAMEAAGGQVGDIPADLANHARYRIVDLLGTGGMGAVYKAEHRLMQRLVALKVINPKFTVSKQAVERFRREAQAAARLDHPHIVRAHDAEQAGDLHFLVMEYVPGTDLGKILEDRGPLPVAEACEYIRQAALGLQHAHESGMVHRDIKPQNLMLSTGRDSSATVVKILDFGLASLTTEAITPDSDTQLPTENDNQKSCLTQAGSLMGTPDYMAPEQGRDASSADIRSDIYSLGCTLYALLAGTVPFPGGNAIDKILAHTTRPARPIGELRKDVPASLVKVLDTMMAKNPADRYQTPSEVAAALAPTVPRNRRAANNNRWSAHASVGALAAVVLLFAGGIFYVTTDNGALKIDCKVDDVKVVLSQGGKEFETIDLKSGSTVKRLRSGAYDIKLKGEANGVTLSESGFTLTRGRESIVTVTKTAPPNGVATAPPAAPDSFPKLAKPHVPDDDMQALQGTWKPIAVFRSTGFVSQDEFKQIGVVFSGNTMRWTMPGGRTHEGKFKIDPQRRPKEIELIPPGAKGLLGIAKGLYSLVGGENTNGEFLLTICIAEPVAGAAQDTRPARLDTVKDPKHILMTFRRETPEWSPLFNGKDLTGWIPVYDAKTNRSAPWDIVGNVLVLKGDEKNRGYLRTENQYREFHLRFEYKPTTFAPQNIFRNSMVMWGIQGPDSTADAPNAVWWELAQKKDGRPACTIFGPAELNIPVLSVLGEETPADGWNRAEVIAREDGLELRVNGVSKIVKGFRPIQGAIGLLGDMNGLHFRNIELKNLATTVPLADAPRLLREIDNQSQVRALAYAPDGKSLIVGSDTVTVYDPAGNVLHQELLKKGQFATQLSVSADGKTLAAGYQSGILILDLANRKRIKDLPVQSSSGFTFSVAMSPDATRVAYASDGAMRIHRLDTDKTETVPVTDKFGVFGIRYSPDGRYLVNTANDLLMILDAKTHAVVDKRLIGSVGLSDIPKDGKRLVILSSKNPKEPIFAVFGLPDANAIYRETNIPACGSLSLSPDGNFLALGTLDGAAQIWDLNRKKLAASWRIEPINPAKPLLVTTVAFAPDGKSLATGALNAVKIWDLTPPSAAARTKSDKETILGNWTPVSAESFGQPVPVELIELLHPKLTVAPDKLTLKIDLDMMPIPVEAFKKLVKQFEGKDKAFLPAEWDAVFDKKGVEAIYTLDPTTTPKSANISYLSPVRKTLLGIYSLEGDTLKICMAVDPDRADQRPTTFTTGPGQCCVTLKRVP